MPMGILFWVIMLLWFIFGLWWNWRPEGGPNFAPLGGHVLLFLLFMLLGWRVFGPPLQ